MSGVVVSPPHLTASAHALLAGRPVHVRSSRRHGCCGGAASVPVAEPGAPESLDGVEHFEVSGAVVYVDRDMLGTEHGWVIDTEGFAKWRRLVVLGLDLAPG
jgi:hypothetical protein